MTVSESSLGRWYTGFTLTQSCWAITRGRWASFGRRDSVTGCRWQHLAFLNIMLPFSPSPLHLSLGFTELCSHARIHRRSKWSAIDSTSRTARMIIYSALTSINFLSTIIAFAIRQRYPRTIILLQIIYSALCEHKINCLCDPRTYYYPVSSLRSAKKTVSKNNNIIVTYIADRKKIMIYIVPVHARRSVW